MRQLDVAREERLLSPSNDRSSGGIGGTAGSPPSAWRRGVAFAAGLVVAAGLAHGASAGVVVPGSLQAAEAANRPALSAAAPDGGLGTSRAPSPGGEEVVIGLDDAGIDTKLDGAAILDDAVFSTLQPQGFDPFAAETGDDSPLAVTIVNASGVRRARWENTRSGSNLGIHRPSLQSGLRGLLAQYVNIIPTRGPSSAARAEPATRALDDSGAGAPPLAIDGNPIAERVSETVSDWLGQVLRPTTGVEGLVSFSVVGFGNFAIVASEDSRRIGVMDLNSGRVMTVSTNHIAARSGNTVMIDRRTTGEHKRRRTRATRFSDVIGAIVAFLYEFVTSPLKMSFVILALIVWGVWRVSASRA